MEKLKTHPREEAVNRLLLRRAERLYQELSLDARLILGQLLDGFEAALAMQNEGAIDRNRAALQEFLDRAEAGWSDDAQGGDDDDWYKP